MFKWIWIYYTTNYWNSHNISFFFSFSLFLSVSELSTMFFAVFFSRYWFYLVIIGKSGLNESKVRCSLGDKDIEQKMWKTFESFCIEFLTLIYHFENFSKFLQYFKNCAGYKLKLPKRETPAGIGRPGMSVLYAVFVASCQFSTNNALGCIL